ncbi:hypothetical protein [Sphingobium sp.]|nr:hypothetical protein [Sphingobium sp.]
MSTGKYMMIPDRIAAVTVLPACENGGPMNDVMARVDGGIYA